MIKKHISKKITALAVTVVLSAMSCMPVLAGYINEIGWSEDRCPNCNEDVAIWIQEVHMDPWMYSNSKCTHYEFGVDEHFVKCIITNYDCRQCNYGWSEEEKIYFTQCCGYEKPEKPDQPE